MHHIYLSAFEKSIEQDENVEENVLANSMLVFLVKGLFHKFEFPYSQFPCTALSGDEMYDPLWEAVGRLELCGFNVMGLRCDGFSANRRFFRLHNPTTKGTMMYKVDNPYADGKDPFILFLQ